MNIKEKKGLSELLSDLSLPDLVEIASLTTNRQTAEYREGMTAEEVIADIIAHAGSSSEVLHRQKVSKELLLKYLESNKVAVQPKGGRRKDFIRRCLALWDASDEHKDDQYTRQTRSAIRSS